MLINVIYELFEKFPNFIMKYTIFGRFVKLAERFEIIYT